VGAVRSRNPKQPDRDRDRFPPAGAEEELELPSSAFGVFMKLSVSALSW